MNDKRLREAILKSGKFKFTGVKIYTTKVKWNNHRQKFIVKYPELVTVNFFKKNGFIEVTRTDGKRSFFSLKQKDINLFSTTKEDMLENYKTVFQKKWNRLAIEEQNKINFFLKGLTNEEKI